MPYEQEFTDACPLFMERIMLQQLPNPSISSLRGTGKPFPHNRRGGVNVTL
jgi:hypothetical protein